jgi:hypothetical protein
MDDDDPRIPSRHPPRDEDPDDEDRST